MARASLNALGWLMMPSTPQVDVVGSLTGGLFIYYNDGTSSQWVQVNGVAT